MPKRIIYKVIHRGSGKVYIGATSKSIEERKADHIQKSKTGNGSYFQEAIGTYGPDDFSWEQVDTANDSNELAEKEKQFILEYDSQENGFNLDGGGGIKKKVYQYDPETLLILGEYECLAKAGFSVGAHKNSIAKACSGENRTCKGYYWSYSLTEPFLPPLDLKRKGVLQFDLEGNLLAKYNSVAKASKKTGVSKSCIARCCRGERDNSGGYIWKYKND